MPATIYTTTPIRIYLYPLDSQTYFSNLYLKYIEMKKYLTLSNILRALTILMLIYYFNHEGMTNVYQIIDTVKSLFK